MAIALSPLRLFKAAPRVHTQSGSGPVRPGNGGSSSPSSSSRSSPSAPKESGVAVRDSSRGGQQDRKGTPTSDTEIRPEADTSSSSSSSSSPSSSSSSPSSSPSSSSPPLSSDSSPSSPDSSSGSSSSSTSSSASGSGQSGNSRTSSSSTTGRFTGSGSVMINGRKVTLPSRWNRLMTGQRKPGSGFTSTSTGSGSTSQTQNQNQNKESAPPSPSIQDTIGPQESNRESQPSTRRQTTKDEEPTTSYETSSSHSSVAKKDGADETKRAEEEGKQGSSPHSSSRQSPSLTPSHSGRGASSALPSQNARPGVVQRFPPRQDGRIPWSRTSSSSVGNRRPVLRANTPRLDVSETPERGDKTRTASSSYPSKHKLDDTSPKPSVLNRDRVSTGSRPHSSTRTDSHTPKQSSQIDNDHEDDYDYEDYDKYDKVAEPTAAFKTTTSSTTTTTTTTASTTRTTTTAPTTTTASTASPVQRSGDYSERRGQIPGRTGSQSVPPYGRRPLQGSNGRTRSPVIASNRQGGSRFLGRLSPVQHTKLGSKPDSSSPHLSSSSSSSSSSSQSSRGLPKPSQVSEQDVSNSRIPSSGSVSRSSGRQIPGENPPIISSGSQPSSPVERSAVVGSRLRNPSRFDSILRGKTPVNGFKPSYGQGRVMLSQLSVSLLSRTSRRSKNYSTTEIHISLIGYVSSSDDLAS